MMILLAILGFTVLMRQIYLLVAKHQKLKAENECLRRYWKERMTGKP